MSAALLNQQGYRVVGVYMKNWSQDLPGMPCTWQEDYQDAKRVAVQLGIEFKMYDFQKQYRHKVVDYMLEEFQAGRTPNPDIMCNQEIKFKLFALASFEDGADLIATGHYAKTKNGRLYMAADDNKDQTYFLYRVTSDVLQKTIFPLGGLAKPQVRDLAKKLGLVTADKKDSMGICFVGKVGIKEFLAHELTQNFQGRYLETGAIIDQTGKQIGQHDGAIFYTIGQRHGLDVGGGLPLYVTGKDMTKNEVYVTTDLQDEKLWSNEVSLKDLHWIDPDFAAAYKLKPKTYKLSVRLRHRAKMLDVKMLDLLSNSKAAAELAEEVRALTPGQSAVFYSGSECLGGGIVV